MLLSEPEEDRQTTQEPEQKSENAIESTTLEANLNKTDEIDQGM